MRPLLLPPLSVALSAALTGDAVAADANRPATPASFPDTPCLLVVDRSVDPVLHIEYAVPADDTDVQPTEVANGRTLQFFAFATQFLHEPPNWVTRADVDAAAAAEASATESMNIPDAEILGNNDAWPTDSWVRITPDDARLPITMAQAGMGVDWDTTGLPEGTYVIWAYTWDPARNLWSRRPGAVRVVDDAADLSEDSPTFFFDQPTSDVALAGSTRTVQACVTAPEGSTVTLDFGVLDGLADPDWITWACDESVTEGENTFEFPVPDPTDPLNLHLRATITDPEGRSYQAFTPALAVTAGSGAPLPAAVQCTDDGGEGGCSTCRVAPTLPGALPLMLVLGLGVAGRRRPETLSQ